MRNLLLSFAEAIQAGAKPRPVQVAPVFGSRYFGGTVRFLAGFAPLVGAVVAPPIRNFERSLTSLIHAGGRAWPLQVSPVLGFMYFAGSFPLPA
ncbi:hypothetical protein WJ96_05810 [Burkholderia ubonensis]|uniref:Uncharacterized protein n=1 Tax=Burkholderia ubonensis TaxID=101571 RepID=A0AAW3MYL5_9BURK|nr:hypothetical protein WJ93_07605 [Burkholderia ubonensis]KVP96740.1 hypothetical protein WJ97_12735 [Burkholderia ubonensis]KVP98085.1 hypothetical protein WJ96_05810 [Burkholderia ubonensis]KVZ92782.1 hypothetical protein WL25_17470 [Burkholderia ubonensis]